MERESGDFDARRVMKRRAEALKGQGIEGTDGVTPVALNFVQ
jgi:hypothetical protein